MDYHSIPSSIERDNPSPKPRNGNPLPAHGPRHLTIETEANVALVTTIHATSHVLISSRNHYLLIVHHLRALCRNPEQTLATGTKGRPMLDTNDQP
jgi:hypothetical protein